jgi:adenosylcobinamide-GDP ribazoletransferase
MAEAPAMAEPMGTEPMETTAATPPAAPANPWWREIVAGPVLTLQFLTAVPIPFAVPATPRHLGRALALFPLGGAAIGLALAGLDVILLRALPVSVATPLILGASVLLTGALHLDGLMDTCDGVFGGRTVERRLEIMRDSRVGSYGVLAGVLQLLLKYAALSALPLAARGAALILSLTAGRWAMVGVMQVFPYARPQGIGAAFKAAVSWLAVAVAIVLAAAIGWATFGLGGVVCLAVAGIVAVALARYLAAKLGGLTGDCYGAVNEVVESTVMLLILGWLGQASHG